MVEHRLLNSLEQPFMWCDSRRNDDVNAADCWAAERGANWAFVPAPNDQLKREGIWQEHSKGSITWQDNRSSKHCSDSPKCGDNTNKDSFRMDNSKTQKREKIAPERKTLRTLGGGSLQSGSSYSAGRTRNAIHKNLLQLSVAERIPTHNTDRGNEFQLLDMYVKGGSMVDAYLLFDSMPKQKAVLWNMMILGYAKQGEGVLALELYSQMHQEGVQPTDRTFVAALKACGSLAALEQKKQVDGKIVKPGCLDKGRAIHLQAVKFGFESDVFVGTILVDMYVKCGSIEDARHVFDTLPGRDVVSWNTMISGYAQKEESVLALELYVQMQHEGVKPDHLTFVSTLKACTGLAAVEMARYGLWKFVTIGCLERGRAIHSQVVKSGFDLDSLVGTTLVDMYVKCGCVKDARHVFDDLPQHDVVSWTCMISGYAQEEEGLLALDLCACMNQEGIMPNNQTLSAMLKACSSLAAVEEGKQVQGKFVKAVCLEKGRAIHSLAVKSGCQFDVVVGTSLLGMYAKCGSMHDALHVFNELPLYNVVSWTAIICGYAEQGENGEAFKYYAQMQEHGVQANSFTFVSVLKACGNTAALETGRELHSEICKTGLESASVVATTLIDMYAKCGSMTDAQQLFDALPTRDFITWNALITGYARQGESGLVFQLFDRMGQEGIRPNEVTFLSVLTVCSHVGLVDKGQKYFQAMSKEHCVVPTIEHYTCMIDLLARVGKVEEAVAMVKEMPFQPNAVSWHAVLSACQKWKNLEVGRCMFDHAVDLDEKNATAYVLMSNIYANAHVGES